MADEITRQSVTTSARMGVYNRLHKPVSFTIRILALFAFQAILALLIYRSGRFSTIHALATLAVGAWLLLTTKEPDKLFYWMGYVAGAELVWRATNANVFWETGKYAVIVVGLLGFLKGAGKVKPNLSLVPYFLLMVPGILLMPSFDREAIAFALAGPLAMAVVSVFASRVTLKTEQIKIFLLVTLASVLILSVLALAGIINAEKIDFTAGSNLATSANTGPNQVSSILALGAFAAFIYAFLERERKFLRFLVLLLGIGLLTQIALTFSRGGLWTLVGALLAGGFFFMRDRKSRRSYMAVTLLSALAFIFLILPRLDQWTSGALNARLQDTEPTGRIEIIESDLEVFKENPLFGIGIGQSIIQHARYFRVANAHTEYSRMLAEHGMLGLFSLLILMVALAFRFFHKDPPLTKAFMVACITWGLLFMAHSATRLVAPSLLIGISFANFDLSIPIGEAVEEQKSSRYRRTSTRFKSHKA